MGKHRQTHRVYLGVSGMVAVAALVVALTFGLSSAQDGGGFTPPPSGGSTPPPSYSGSPPPPGDMHQPPPGDMHQPPPGGTPPPGGSPPYPSGSTPPPSGSYPTGSGAMPYPGGSGSMPQGGAPCQPGQPCSTGGQMMDSQNMRVCAQGEQPTSSNPCRTDHPYQGGQSGQQNFSNMPPCAPGQQPTSANPCQMGGSSSGQQGQQNLSNMPVCAQGQQPTAAAPCRMEGYQGQGQQGQQNWQDMPVCAQGQQPTSDKPCRMEGYQGQGQQGQQGNMPVCPDGRQSTPGNPCTMDGGQYGRGMQNGQFGRGDMMRGAPGEGGNFYTPGQCPSQMQSCPNPMDPSNTICMPKQSWDFQTNKMKEATCADFEPGKNMGPGGPGMMGGPGGPGGTMGGPGGPGGMMGGPGFGPGSFNGGFGGTHFFGEGGEFGRGEGQPTDPCVFNPNDPLCKAGFNFNDLRKGFMYDESQFDPSQFQVKNTKSALREMQNECKHIKRDVADARRQLKEVARESAAVTCPAAVEVDAIVSELEGFCSDVSQLTSESSEEDISRARAKLDYIRGSFDPETGEQTVGLRGQLFGGPPNEDGEPTPGKMQGLNVCRELSGAVFGACEAYKHVNREYEKMKKAKMADSVLSVFATVVPELQKRCENPMAVLTEAGVNLTDLSEPWYPDPEVCSFGFGPFGPGPGGPGFGPGPGGPGGPGFGPGGPFPMDFGGDFDPEMMRMMEKKMREMQEGGFNPFGASVIGFSHPEFVGDDEEEFDEEEFGDEGFRMGPPEMDEECMPPVMRYLGIEKIMRQLDEARFAAEREFGSMNACSMFEMGKESLDEGQGFGPPPQMRKLLEQGLAACEEGDSETVEAIKRKMLRFAGRGGPGGGLGEVVDIDQLIEDKLKEKLGEIDFGDDEEDVVNEKIAELQSKLDDLQSKFSDAQKTILALNEKLADTMTKLTQAVDKLGEKASAAFGNLTQLPNEEVQTRVASTIGELADKVDALKDVTPNDGDKLLDKVLDAFVQAPPSQEILGEIKEGLTAVQSYCSSGATKKECSEKVRDEVASITVLNAQDVTNKIEEGFVAYEDTANLGDWYAIAALKAKEAGLASSELTKINPAGEESLGAAMVRACRIADIDFEEVKSAEDAADVHLTKEVAGVPFWARGCLAELQERGEQIALNPPLRLDSPVDRGTVAEVFTQVLNLEVPTGDELKELLPPDVAANDADAPFIGAMLQSGCMKSVDGTNFGADVGFNRAQNMLVSTCLVDHLEEVKGE